MPSPTPDSLKVMSSLGSAWDWAWTGGYRGLTGSLEEFVRQPQASLPYSAGNFRGRVVTA